MDITLTHPDGSTKVYKDAVMLHSDATHVCFENETGAGMVPFSYVNDGKAIARAIEDNGVPDDLVNLRTFIAWGAAL